MKSVQLITDGACIGNPGPGGWACILRYKDKKREMYGSERKTTNNRMELTAAVRALQALKFPCQVDFYTDSEYLKRGITEWLPGWRARHWRRKGGALANVDLWKALDAALGPHTVHWYWVRGHAGHPENERVDRLAKSAIPKRSL